jgi:hypothetical protein
MCCWPTCAVGSVSTERWCETVLRRVLSRRVSVEAMIEFALWMAIPYIVVGLVFAFFGVEQVQLIETQLQTRLPAGSGSHLRCHFCLPLSWCFGRCSRLSQPGLSHGTVHFLAGA